MISRRYINKFVTMATVSMVMIKLKLSNSFVKIQVETIYCSGDIGWGLVDRLPISAVKCDKAQG